MASPVISVVIPSHNRGPFILQALNSVFAQTFHDYEVIVIDDGSTDGTQELLGPLIAKKSIRYEWQPARGVSAARNRGIQLAQSAYIAFLDSDDLFLATKLEKQMQVFARDPDLGFVHCSFAKFDETGRDLGVRDTSRFQGMIYPSMLLEWSMLMAMPCMLMRKDVLLAVGGFDEEMAWVEDLDLWRRISRRHRVGVVPEVLVRVRVHSTSSSFDRRGGIKGFERYLEKASEDDPGLGATFWRHVTAKMYAKLAQNLLGEGGSAEMKQVRRLSLRALAAWPLQFSAMLAWLASFLPVTWRHALATSLRRSRYPVVKT